MVASIFLCIISWVILVLVSSVQSVRVFQALVMVCLEAVIICSKSFKWALLRSWAQWFNNANAGSGWGHPKDLNPKLPHNRTGSPNVSMCACLPTMHKHLRILAGTKYQCRRTLIVGFYRQHILRGRFGHSPNGIPILSLQLHSEIRDPVWSIRGSDRRVEVRSGFDIRPRACESELQIGSD